MGQSHLGYNEQDFADDSNNTTTYSKETEGNEKGKG
jgi:hypothetical protein